MCIRDRLNNLMPGIWSKHTLLYGVEVKYYSARVKVREDMSSEVDGLFAIGDGAGITRSPVSYTHLDVYKRQVPY